MRALSARERRLVAVLILLALLALLQFAIVRPIVSGFAVRAERRRALLIEYRINDRAIAAIPRLRRQAELQHGLMDDFTLAAPDPGTAGELLKERLQHAVETGGGEFREGVGVAARPGWVAARVTTRLSIDQLTRLLAVVQNQRPYIIVDSLVVAADEALIVGHPSALDTQLEASVPVRAAVAR